jgi:hypothetical protein
MNLVRSQIPADIVTVEELVMWGEGALQTGTGGREIVEQEGTRPEPVAYQTVFRIPDNSYRAVARVSLPLKADYQTTLVPFWKKVGIVADMDIPVAFRAA